MIEKLPNINVNRVDEQTGKVMKDIVGKINEIIGIVNDMIKEFHEQGIEIYDTRGESHEIQDR